MSIRIPPPLGFLLAAGLLAVVTLTVGGCTQTASSDPDADLATDSGMTVDADLSDAGANVDADLSDAGGNVDAGAPDGGTYVYSCSPVGDSFSDGFFTLATFNNQVYAGQFGYGYESQSMVFRYPAWEHVSPGLTGIGESVCAMREFGGYLYANTEHSGDIFRSADGATWELVYNGDGGSIGCGLAELNGQLYAVNYNYATSTHGRVLRQDGASWTTVYDSGAQPLYLREIVAYNGVLYAFGVMNQQGQMVTSTDGINWTLQTVANRYFRAHVWGGYLWLGSSDFYAAGETAVWRFDGVSFLRTHPVGGQSHVADLQDVDGNLFASTSNGWKTESGPSYLLMSPDGLQDWQTVCTFSETAAWSMTVLGTELYVGTWEFGQGGHVYRVTRTLVEE